ncbi:hypothetical protein QVD17_15421 [Tagetes erecta]|uniref:Non-specific lipid-transfer protein n=1 Tax=Tagetes erecta TaxID=13708 RepID=A0AAD8KPN0_TARER|nr:hypothetical protein QVD17_15421 [Tagetes erecta]
MAAAVAKVALVALMCFMVTSAPYTADGAVTCQMALSSLVPCASYVTSGGPVPSSCCSGIKSVYKAASTTADRQTVCRCLEQVASMVGTGANIDAAISLPRKCGVKIPYKISPTQDCSNVVSGGDVGWWKTVVLVLSSVGAGCTENIKVDVLKAAGRMRTH